MESISDDVLMHIGRAIGDDARLNFLAFRLGFSLADVECCHKSNREMEDGCEGTQTLLSNWNSRTDTKEQVSQLRQIMNESGLKEIADVFLPQDGKRKFFRHSHNGLVTNAFTNAVRTNF